MNSATLAESVFSLCLASDTGLRPREFWQGWSFAPATVLPLALTLLLYLRGDAILRARTAAGPEPARLSAFVAGWLLLVAALVSPLCRLAATLVSAHMVQLMLLSVVAPVLLVVGRAWPVMREALPETVRARFLGAPDRPGAAWPIATAYGALLWLWHVPAVYEAALTSAAWHIGLYAAMTLAAVAFWSTMLRPGAQRIGAMGILFVTLVHTGLLGALLTFAPRLLYPTVAGAAADWGLGPASDQQLAGLIMWVGGGVLYMLAALAVAWAWLAELGAESRTHSWTKSIVQ